MAEATKEKTARGESSREARTVLAHSAALRESVEGRGGCSGTVHGVSSCPDVLLAIEARLLSLIESDGPRSARKSAKAKLMRNNVVDRAAMESGVVASVNVLRSGETARMTNPKRT